MVRRYIFARSQNLKCFTYISKTYLHNSNQCINKALIRTSVVYYTRVWYVRVGAPAKIIT